MQVELFWHWNAVKDGSERLWTAPWLPSKQMAASSSLVSRSIFRALGSHNPSISLSACGVDVAMNVAKVQHCVAVVSNRRPQSLFGLAIGQSWCQIRFPLRWLVLGRVFTSSKPLTMMGN